MRRVGLVCATAASFADEFMKLAKLKEQGILSEQEFSDMKAALIAQAKKNAAN